MNAHPYHAKLKRILDRAGDLYTLNDILATLAQQQDAVVGRGRVVGLDPHRALPARPKWSRFSLSSGASTRRASCTTGS